MTSKAPRPEPAVGSSSDQPSPAVLGTAPRGPTAAPANPDSAAGPPQGPPSIPDPAAGPPQGPPSIPDPAAGPPQGPPPTRVEAVALARRLYEASDLPVAAIGARAGLHGSTVSRRARAEGWRRLVPSLAEPGGGGRDDAESGPGAGSPPPDGSAPQPATPPRPGSPEARRRLVERLWRAVDRQAALLERAGGGEAGLSRDLAQLVRALETIATLETAAPPAPCERCPHAGAPARSLPELRDELLRQMLRFRDERRAKEEAWRAGRRARQAGPDPGAGDPPPVAASGR